MIKLIAVVSVGRISESEAALKCARTVLRIVDFAHGGKAVFGGIVAVDFAAAADGSSKRAAGLLLLLADELAALIVAVCEGAVGDVEAGGEGFAEQGDVGEQVVFVFGAGQRLG